MSETSPRKERHFLFILSSSRRGGNSEQIARHAAQQLPPTVKQTWLHLQDLPMDEFVDQRHQGDGSYAAPQGAADTLLQASLNATDLVFVTPLYWYSLPTLAKRYLDHWSAWMRVPGLDFRARMAGKHLWNITTSSDQDQSFAQPLVESLRITAGYMQMHWHDSLITYGNRPGDVMLDVDSVQRAEHYFLSV